MLQDFNQNSKFFLFAVLQLRNFLSWINLWHNLIGQYFQDFSTLFYLSLKQGFVHRSWIRPKSSTNYVQIQICCLLVFLFLKELIAQVLDFDNVFKFMIIHWLITWSLCLHHIFHSLQIFIIHVFHILRRFLQHFWINVIHPSHFKSGFNLLIGHRTDPIGGCFDHFRINILELFRVHILQQIRIKHGAIINNYNYHRVMQVTLQNLVMPQSLSSPKPLNQYFQGPLMNQTFSDWQRMKKKKQILNEDDSNQSSRQSFRGITLQQYMRVKSSNESKASLAIKDQDTHVNSYINQQFEIDEKDENLSTNQQEKDVSIIDEPIPIQISQMQKKILNKYGKRNKLKTETKQQITELNIKRHHRFPTMFNEESAMLHTFGKLDTGITKPRNSASPMENMDKYDCDYKKNKILEKVKQEKSRINELKQSEYGYVNKYANKFNINQNVCKQIIKELRT